MKRCLLAFCTLLILASQAVGGLVGGTNAAAITGLATEHNYLSHPQWEELAEALKTECPDGNEACKEGVYERYRKISEKQEEEFAQCVLSGGDCSEHLEAIAGVNAHALAQKYGLDISDLHNSEALANLVDIQGKDSLNLMFTNSASYDVKDAQNFSASNCSGVTASACLSGYREKIRLESEARVLAAAGIVIDFIPVAGDLKAIYDCGNQPDISTCSAMIAGIAPGIGDGASLLIRKGDDIIDSTNITKRVDDIGDTKPKIDGGGGNVTGGGSKPDTPDTTEPVGDIGGGVVGTKNVVQVDVSKAQKGTPEYEALNNPKPNTTTELSNGTTFKTGEGGYVDEVTYKPVDSPDIRDARQTQVGKEGIAGDVGGHIQACRHGGTCDRFNLFPQNSNFNNSAYKRWENEITRALQNGDDVGSVTVRLNRADPYNPRPDSVRIEYKINGIPFERKFNNQHGG